MSTTDELTAIALKVHKILEMERQQRLKSGKVIATRDWFDKNYGEAVMRQLVKHKLIFPYAFGTREVTGPDGEPVVKRQGAIYFRVSDVESAIEDFNIYKTLQESYKRRRIDFKEKIQSLTPNAQQ